MDNSGKMVVSRWEASSSFGDLSHMACVVSLNGTLAIGMDISSENLAAQRLPCVTVSGLPQITTRHPGRTNCTRETKLSTPGL